ncbi:DNA-directed RNA polymerase subunit delta [Thalassobacillus hwangdonensis]|uniref:Probable DNA-directed RNA polymerase subunit delta n=1 Tax=Thalassobacillus hwangdonensis TaxID=546108 RepID=A0ABW3L5P2_9BACI
MSLKDLSNDQIQEMSMIELSTIILEEEKKAIDFNDLFNRIADLKNYSQQKKEDYIAQFYTDMNIDGGFMTIGTNLWGLKSWYPVEQMEEEISTLSQKRKKKKTKKRKTKKAADLDDELLDEDLEEDLDLDDDDLDLDSDDDDYDGDYDNDDLDEEDEEVIEDDISFIGDDDESEEDDDL